MGIDHVVTLPAAPGLEAGVSTQLAKTRPSDFIANLTVTGTASPYLIRTTYFMRAASSSSPTTSRSRPAWRARRAGSDRRGTAPRCPVWHASLPRVSLMRRERSELRRAGVMRLGTRHQASHALPPCDAVAARIASGDGEPRLRRVGQHRLARHAVEGTDDGKQQRRRYCERRGEGCGARPEVLERSVVAFHGHLLGKGFEGRRSASRSIAVWGIKSEYMANLLRFCRTNSSPRVLDAHAEWRDRRACGRRTMKSTCRPRSG